MVIEGVYRSEFKVRSSDCGVGWVPGVDFIYFGRHLKYAIFTEKQLSPSVLATQTNLTKCNLATSEHAISAIRTDTWGLGEVEFLLR